MLRLFRISDNRAAAINSQLAIFPGYIAPVVRTASDGARERVNLNWGFVLLQKGPAPRRITNMRDDNILSIKFWRPSFEQRRCLVQHSFQVRGKHLFRQQGLRAVAHGRDWRRVRRRGC